eukprot:scaffold1311_cov256-Pinguiococcus_pyrenoidosus.AAC.1
MARQHLGSPRRSQPKQQRGRSDQTGLVHRKMPTRARVRSCIDRCMLASPLPRRLASAHPIFFSSCLGCIGLASSRSFLLPLPLSTCLSQSFEGDRSASIFLPRLGGLVKDAAFVALVAAGATRSVSLLCEVLHHTT